MPTQSGKVQNFQNVTLSIGSGFRADAFDDGGIAVAWQGDAFTVKVGPDGVAIYVGTGFAYAIMTLNFLSAANGIEYTHGWLLSGIPRPLALIDGNGTTFLTEARALPRQRPNITFNGASNPWSVDIHCPNFTGPIGGLNNT